MLRARSLRAAPVAPPPRPAAPPIYETSHQIREKSQTLDVARTATSQTALAPTPRPVTLPREEYRPLREKSHTTASSARRAAPRPCFSTLFVLLFLLAPVFLSVLLTPTTAHAQAKGAACPVNGYTAAATQATGGQNLVCSSLTWAYVPYQFGASAGTCPGTGNVNLGMLQWTGSAFQGCTASGWGSLAGGGTTALSSITSATAAYSFDNTSMAQTWTWNSLTTQTAFTLSSSSLTNGNILSIQNTAASATSTGKVLSISDATTGSGYGVYSVMTGKGNTGYAGYFTNTGSTNSGYAGYFINTDTSSSSNFGVYGIVNSTGGNSAGVYGGTNSTGAGSGVEGATNSTAFPAAGVFGYAVNGGNSTAAGGLFNYGGTGSGYGVYSQAYGHGNTGYAGYFINTDTGADANWGIYATNASTGTGTGVHGRVTAAANTGYGGYFENDSTVDQAGGGGSAIYATVNNTDQAIYAYNSSATGGDAVLPMQMQAALSRAKLMAPQIRARWSRAPIAAPPTPAMPDTSPTPIRAATSIMASTHPFPAQTPGPDISTATST